MEGIFGRDLELAAMERFLDGAPTWPSAVVIEGEAGIGKTTLWLEAVRRAEERGIRVLRARPAESEQKLSYVALADLVDEAFDEVGELAQRRPRVDGQRPQRPHERQELLGHRLGLVDQRREVRRRAVSAGLRVGRR